MIRQTSPDSRAARSWRPSLAMALLFGLTALAGAAEVLPTTVFANLQAGRKQTVVVYGTSLSHGGEWAVATKAWFDGRFPGQVVFVNSAGPGQNSDWGLANLAKNVLDHRPDLVILEFSFNDAHAKFAMPVAKGAANLDQIVSGIRKRQPACDIVLQVMNAAWDAPNDKRSLGNRPQLQAFNDNYRAYAAKHGLPLIDHYPAWLRLKEQDPERYHQLVPDGTHPTREGSLAITWPAVKALLERAAAAKKK
jgi:lysophospholipase L1-like esterase